ncbi:GerMN domain-containing protein [Paenibacillus sp. YPG26]|uniref:GerMN domain-containing protein n=1 Tax=Paenibacillus sp. YPG26 TaxID=2878915 RepID=UPI002040B07D|nr:GerMN domain-containing protein [Paenibacillus sp. YPG26]USB34827.1 GerMN domain-containing protein [Paenibacillus sp. YPG26]
MKTKSMITGLLLLLTLVSAGCAQKPQSAPPDNGQTSAPGVTRVSQEKVTTPDTSPDSTIAAASPGETAEQTKEAGTKLTISSYYTDSDMLELKEESKDIFYKDGQDKYEKAFKALQDSGSDKLFALWQKVELKSLEIKNGEVTLDIHLPDEARLGAGGEVLAIEALKKTFFQFEEVKSIELLVDGSKVDTLMGHEELEHPMTRS